MKLLYSSPNHAEVGLLQGTLEAEGIQCEMRNASAQAAYFPSAEFYPELWILSEDDFPKAVELRDAWLATPSSSRTGWTCPGCGERLEAQFVACWKCGALREDRTPPAANP